MQTQLPEKLEGAKLLLKIFYGKFFKSKKLVLFNSVLLETI